MSQKSIVGKVVEFNRTILKLPQKKVVEELNDIDYVLAVKQLTEEIGEFELANEEHDLVGQIDALADLVYFAIGVMFKLGLSPNNIEAVFSAVHAANMTKKIGVKASRVVEGAVDAIKPNDFQDPKHAIQEIINVRR